MHQIYCNGSLFEVEKYGLVSTYASQYMHFYVWFLFWMFYKDSIYDILKQHKHKCKTFARNTLTKKKIWTFEWLEMGHIFISPYHNQVLVDFKFLC
jgi:hypothetical protein